MFYTKAFCPGKMLSFWQCNTFNFIFILFNTASMYTKLCFPSYCKIISLHVTQDNLSKGNTLASFEVDGSIPSFVSAFSEWEDCPERFWDSDVASLLLSKTFCFGLLVGNCFTHIYIYIHIYIYMYIYVQSADICFAILQLISAAWNELGLIRDQSAQTTTQAVGIA